MYLTALVIDGMQMLKEVGYKPGDEMINGGKKWLRTNSVES